MTKHEIVRDAYVYGYPLVTMDMFRKHETKQAAEPDHPEGMTTEGGEGGMVCRRLPQSSGEPARAASEGAGVDTAA